MRGGLAYKQVQTCVAGASVPHVTLSIWTPDAQGYERNPPREENLGVFGGNIEFRVFRREAEGSPQDLSTST